MWRDKGDFAARNRLVTSHQALRLQPSPGKGREPDSDLLQHANIGLLKAADRFDRQGFSFLHLCCMVDQAEIQDYRIRSWSLVRFRIQHPT
jgi:RNA polymerase sigma-32 factor